MHIVKHQWRVPSCSSIFVVAVPLLLLLMHLTCAQCKLCLVKISFLRSEIRMRFAGRMYRTLVTHIPQNVNCAAHKRAKKCTSMHLAPYWPVLFAENWTNVGKLMQFQLVFPTECGNCLRRARDDAPHCRKCHIHYIENAEIEYHLRRDTLPTPNFRFRHFHENVSQTRLNAASAALLHSGAQWVGNEQRDALTLASQVYWISVFDDFRGSKCNMRRNVVGE